MPQPYDRTRHGVMALKFLASIHNLPVSPELELLEKWSNMPEWERVQTLLAYEQLQG